MTGKAWHRELAVTLVCLAAGALFFLEIGRLWPLASIDLVAPRAALAQRAREFLGARGFDVQAYRTATALTVDGPALDYVEGAFGREQAQSWIAEGLPLVQYRVDLKQRGSPFAFVVWLQPDGPVLGWSRSTEDDEPGAWLELPAARELARAALERELGLSADEYVERSASSTEQVSRRDHGFRFERSLSTHPELKEQVRIRVAGDRVEGARRSLRIPPDARRASRAAEAPGRAFETLGFVLLGLGLLAALVLFLRGLSAGHGNLGRAAIYPTAAAACLLAAYALETPSLFRYWEPLWPRWVSDFRYLSFRAVEGALIALILLVVTAAGDSLDRRLGAGRTTSLWQLARGRIDATVALASGRGFLVGLLCGGVMVLGVLALELLAGARTSIQPRGFFFYALNTAAPAWTTLLFFFGVALGEELGYRLFAGSWLAALVRGARGRLLAIVIPALIYGLTHTRLDFLPPSSPWWGRAFVLTLVGCVWGWAFRYDALTVVVSHFTADLFIFNWPRLGSGKTEHVTVAVLVVLVPLVPAVIWVARRRRRRG